jgi:Zn-dependent peptidase ImmA (M78 family)/DNA-binding XRE family transcriptional regulator
MDEAYITGEVLKWARERRGLSQPQLAKLLKVSTEHIEQWEAEATHPLFGRAEKLAERLKIPFGYFFLSNPPPDDIPLPDLRTISDEMPRALSPDFIEQVNNLLRKQDWYREYLTLNRRQALPFVGSFSTESKPEAVAVAIAATLSINSGLRRRAGTWDAYLSKLINKAEEAGILVIRSGIVKSSTKRRLSVSEFRAFASSDALAPMVFLNGQDSVAARIFSLLHELAHIWLNRSGISNSSGIDEETTLPLEKYCNKVAVEALVPLAEFNDLWDAHGRSPDLVNRLATAFRVSARVIVRRSFELGKVSREQFLRMLEEAKARELPRAKRSGGDATKNLVARNSAPLVEAVVTAVRKNQLHFRDAAQVLGVGIKSIAELTQPRGGKVA